MEAMRSQQTGLVQKGRKIKTNKRVGEGWRVYGGRVDGCRGCSPYLMLKGSRLRQARGKVTSLYVFLSVCVSLLPLLLQMADMKKMKAPV